jgi:hypothetical protein
MTYSAHAVEEHRFGHGTRRTQAGRHPSCRCGGLLAPHGGGRGGDAPTPQSAFSQLVYPKINNHGGRIVKNTGDGLLAEFPSVLGAVRCAVEIQRGMIPISLSSIATISIFAHWPLALRAEATT